MFGRSGIAPSFDPSANAKHLGGLCKFTTNKEDVMLEWLTNEENFDLDQKKTFFGPYPNFIGAVIPLPGAIKSASDALDGQTMPLREALQKIKQTTGQLPVKLIVANRGTASGNGMVFLELGKNKGVIHIFRLIQFRIP